MKDISSVAFQFAVLLILALLIGYELVVNNTVNEVALGAIIGVFLGIPQMFKEKQ